MFGSSLYTIARTISGLGQLAGAAQYVSMLTDNIVRAIRLVARFIIAVVAFCARRPGNSVDPVTDSEAFVQDVAVHLSYECNIKTVWEFKNPRIDPLQ